MDGWMNGWMEEWMDGWMKVPGGAQAACQALQLCQSAVPDLQLINTSIQVVSELRQLLHRPHILHEDLLLEEEEEEEEEEEKEGIPFRQIQ